MSQDRRTPSDPLLDTVQEELDFSEEELAEARRLAAALEPNQRGVTPSLDVTGAVESAVESAALLRVSRALELSQERQADILQNLLTETARTTARRREPARRMWWWLLPLPVAAFAAVFMARSPLATTDTSQSVAVVPESGPVRGAALPQPSAEVIAAQANAIAALLGGTQAKPSLEIPRQYEQAFAAYRTEYLAALEDTYR